MRESNETQALREEVALLRAELQALKSCLSVGQNGEPPHLRVASLEVVGQAPPGQTPRFRVSVEIQEHGGILRFCDTEAGSSATQATLALGEEGVSLALCGLDGAPRAVFSAREEGGGASFVNGNGELAAEVFGADEAAWLLLGHEGTTRVVAVASSGGGNLELFEDETTFVAPPSASAATHSPG